MLIKLLQEKILYACLQKYALYCGTGYVHATCRRWTHNQKFKSFICPLIITILQLIHLNIPWKPKLSFICAAKERATATAKSKLLLFAP
jgi:hypothetical protein